MKKSLLFTAVFGLSLLSAAPVMPDINGNFANKGKYWYVPSGKFCSMKILPAGEMQLNRNPDAPYGDLVCSKGFELKPGDKVAVTVVAKGVGQIGCGVVVNKVGNRTPALTLTPEFKEQTVVVDLSKDQGKLPQKAWAKFIIAQKVYQLTIKSCKVVINPGK